VIRQAASRIAATAPTPENIWAKLLAVERRINALIDGSGIVRYTGPSGGSWSAGQGLNALSPAAGVLINTTSYQAVGPPLQQAVEAAQYKFDGVARLKQGSTASIPGNIGFAGPAASFSVWYGWGATVGGGVVNLGPFSYGSANTVNVLGSVAANTEYHVWFQGWVTLTGTGTFTIGGIAAASHSFTFMQGSTLNVYSA
jgi:hypothetical protein